MICLFAFLIQLGISHFYLPSIRKSDVFPFYDWNLFSFTPADMKFYFLRINKLDGKKLDPPDLVIFQNPAYKPKRFKILALQTIKLGKLLEEENPSQDKITDTKKVLERNLFRGYKSAEYEVDFAHINLRETLKAGTITPEKTIAHLVYSSQELKK